MVAARRFGRRNFVHGGEADSVSTRPQANSGAARTSRGTARMTAAGVREIAYRRVGRREYVGHRTVESRTRIETRDSPSRRLPNTRYATCGPRLRLGRPTI